MQFLVSRHAQHLLYPITPHGGKMARICYVNARSKASTIAGCTTKCAGQASLGMSASFRNRYFHAPGLN